MSFRRTTEDGEIGEEEGEIIASPPAGDRVNPQPGSAQPANPQPGSALPGNAPPLDLGGPHPHPTSYHRNVTPPFRWFPPRGRTGGRGGRGPPPRRSSWTPGESRWGGKVHQGPNEQQPPRRDFPNFVPSSNEAIRKPIFARGESTGSVGSRSFPPTLGFGRNDNFSGRPLEPPRDAFGRLDRTRSEGGVERDACGRQPPQQAEMNAYNAPRPLERQHSEQAETAYGPRPLEHRPSSTAPPPVHRSEQADTTYGPRPLEHRSSITAPPPHRSEQADTSYGPRPLEHRSSITAPPLPHRSEQADTPYHGHRPLEHRSSMTAPPPSHPSEQGDTAYEPRPLEYRTSTTAPPPPRRLEQGDKAHAPRPPEPQNFTTAPLLPHRSEQSDTVYGPRSLEHRTFTTAPPPPNRSEQLDTVYGPQPVEHRASMTAPPPHRSEHVDTAYGSRPPEHRASTTASPPPHLSEQPDRACAPRPPENRASTAAPPPPQHSEQVDTTCGPRPPEHRTSKTAPPPSHRSEQTDTAYGPRPSDNRTSTAPFPPHRSEQADTAYGPRPLEHRTSTAPPLPFSAPPPPPPNLPPPSNLPPPPRRRCSSYGTSAFDRPEATHRASTIGGDYRPERHKSFEPSSPRFGSSPQMQRKIFEGSSTRPSFESSPQMARKGFDFSSPRKGFESSPQYSRQTSPPSRFSEDTFRSLPPPPITSSELLARAPRQDSWKGSAPPKKEEPEPASKLSAPKTPAPKPPAETPLTCWALGDPRIVARAEKIIQQLHELVTFPSQGESVLPTKQLILKAVAGVDLKIKMGQTNTKRVEAELQLAIQAEQDEAERLEKERLEEIQRKMELEQKAKEEKRLEEHRKEIQMQVHERQRVFEQEQQQAQEALEEYIKKRINDERIRLTQEIKSQIEEVSMSFDKDIAKAQKALKKATKATAKAESRMASAVAEYKQSKDTEAGLPELANEQKESSSQEMRDMISSILAENKRRAEQAQLESLALIPYTPDAGSDSNVKTNEEWANEARLVTGLADALYTEPSESPYYEQNNQIHALIEPLVAEHIRKNQRRLQDRWEELAEEYLVRKAIYDKTHTHLHKEKHNKGAKVSCMLGANPSSISGGRGDIGGGRSTSNPYRRARRGNPSSSGDVVRSEYEQEQIIAELTAKEAMEKRIKHGGSKLPRQVCQLEKDLTATYIRTFESHRVEDMLAEAEEQRITNIWSDMEKCIFLDRFLQHPKDFRKIASFLRNKSTKDCIAFYYNSKQTVPYKSALREHIMRRKRRGEYHTWDATIQAALSVGAVVTAGSSEAKPLIFSLPESDKTFFTHNFHPLTHEILAQANIDASDVDVQLTSPRKNRRRSSAPLFTLDAEQRKLLRTSSQEDVTSAKLKTVSELQQEGDDFEEDVQRMDESKKTPVRKAPQKWTDLEKKVFLDTLEKHGKNWSMLASAVGSKSISQIKNYYYDHKKQFSKHRGTAEKSDDYEDGKSRRALALDSTDGDSDFAERVEERHVSGGDGTSTQQQGRGNILMESDSIFEQQGAHGPSLSSAADIWAHTQILNRQQQQQQLSSQEARRLLHSHTHQQVMSNLSTMFPWVSAHVAQAQFQAQAQAAALQQQQHQQQQEGISLGATHAAVRDWIDPATQMHNLLALRPAGHDGFSVDPSSRLRSMALAGMAAMNHQSLASGMLQMDTSSSAPSSYLSSEMDRAVPGFGGTSARIEGGFSMGHGGGAVSAPSSSSSAALALGMLAHSMNLVGDMNNGNGHSMDESNDQSDVNDQYQSG